MREAQLSVWQMLPLGPTGQGNSPYLAASAFAGNPLCIALEPLVADALLTRADLAAPPVFPGGQVAFDEVLPWRLGKLRAAFARFGGAAQLQEEAAAFAQSAAFWLEDWALYCALKESHAGASWVSWPGGLRRRESDSLAAARRDLSQEIAFARFVQFLFARQWKALRTAIHAEGIRLFGDLPIYVAHDSADVWARPELFLLDADGRPQVVAGVPPDAFSEDGQRWGNPLYDWRRHEREGFAWWIARVRANLERFDLLRLDHFRGFAGYWEIPAAAKTAKEGRWRRGPGLKLLRALGREIDPLPLVAEDLGVITEDVEALRLAMGLPGMKVLQFGLGGPDLEGAERLHGPQHHRAENVVYTGTHDNDTSEGWFAALSAVEQEWALEILGRGPEWLSWKMVRTAYCSPARLAITPMQDLLGLGGAARLNTPGVATGNWAWRLLPEQVEPGLAARLARLAAASGRAVFPQS
jgi:4-alpha-glucanotransferase